MTTKSDAKARIDAASDASEKALEHWRKAVDALGATTTVNGVGVIRDRYAFRQRLMEAQARITASFAALDAVSDWPSEADYEHI